MDFETIVTLLLLLFYLLYQMLGRQKRPVQRKPTEVPDAEKKERPSLRTELEEALREIREAMEPPAQPKHEPAPVPDRELSTRSQLELETEKPLPQPANIERVPVRRQKMQSTVSERAVKVIAPPAKAAKPSQTEQESSLPDIDKLNQRIEKQSYLSKQLKNRETLREAIVISEILGPPLSKRR